MPLACVLAIASQQLLMTFAGTLKETIDVWDVKPDTAHRLKAWLTASGQGWKLEDHPDERFFAPSEEDLSAANIDALRERLQILAHLEPRTGQPGWGMGGAQQELERFLKALPAVKADILHPKPGIIIRLEDGAVWLGDKSLASGSLFIRGCYPDLLSAREACIKRYKWTDCETVFTGTPGIGKETWLGESATFCSPRKQLWRGSRKGATTLFLTVPVFSLPELLTMRTLIPEYQHLDEDVVRERFFWAGGSARACLKEASHESDESEHWDGHIKVLLQEGLSQSVLEMMYNIECSGYIPEIYQIFHWDCPNGLPATKFDSSEDLQLHKYKYPCIRFASMRVRDLALMTLDLSKLANFAMGCLSVSDNSRSLTVYWWEILVLRFLQMGPQKLHAAFLPDKGLQCTKVLLNLPQTTLSCISSLQEAATRCRSDMSVLLMSHWETEPTISCISGPVLWWQVAKPEAMSPVRSVLTGMSTAMMHLDGGRHAQLQVLHNRFEWLDVPVDLRLPVLCFAVPPKCFDSLYKIKRPHTHHGQPSDCQEDMIHQLAVRIPLDEILKTCPYRLAVGKFKMDVEQLSFPEGVFTEACMENYADPAHRHRPQPQQLRFSRGGA
ncbi:hypothetical protein COCOBI_12-0260 [Coccomyxa sp. Obi]|nr:hypothetical protein COCOBI_12-0260 [Coccomyxa sp. Obi]